MQCNNHIISQIILYRRSKLYHSRTFSTPSAGSTPPTPSPAPSGRGSEWTWPTRGLTRPWTPRRGDTSGTTSGSASVSSSRYIYKMRLFPTQLSRELLWSIGLLLWFCFFANSRLMGGGRVLIPANVPLPSLLQCFRQFSFTFRDGSGKIGKQGK